MKRINILSLVQAYATLGEESYKNFLDHYGISIKDKEVDDLKSLLNVLYEETEERSIFSQFYVGYKIPQIGKEFDLLRFGKECVINIELKGSSTEEKFLKQLKRNRYYLSSLERQLYGFTFVSDENKLYYLNDKDEIQEVEFSYLIDLLHKQELDNFDDVDALFNPSDYLVSPFNSTDQFINNEYFLTNQQEDVKSKIFKIIENQSKDNFISITGSAGTGKTLLTYDIVKEITSIGKKVLIIHCGYLNDGQIKLNNDYGWTIIPIKRYSSYELSNYDLIIIDEAQRIYPRQLDDIVKKIQSINGNCIFSYDKVQTLAIREDRNNIDQKINDINAITSFKLSQKIRTNKEVASFIKMLFNKSRNIEIVDKNNIEFNYFQNMNDAKEFLEILDSQDWEVIRFTPSQYDNEHHEKYSLITAETSHKVIGQEFDNVAVIIDQHFTYNENDKLIYRGSSYYHPVKMLFQNITRTRKKLNIVIIDNNEILDRCVSILK